MRETMYFLAVLFHLILGKYSFLLRRLGRICEQECEFFVLDFSGLTPNL
jgi:hypothetical protein